MKKTILIITPFLPYPLNSGGNIAQFEINDKLRENFNLIIIFPIKKGRVNSYNELKEKWKDVVFYPYSKKIHSKIIDLLGNSFLSFYKKKKNLLFNKYNNKDKEIINNTTLFRTKKYVMDSYFIDFIGKVINDHSIDYLQIEFFEYAHIVSKLKQNVKKIFVSHEIRFVREQREMKLLENNNQNIKALLEKNKNYEFSKLNEFNRIITVTSDDLNALTKKISANKIYNSPLTIRNRKYSHKKYSFANKLFFLGGDDHFPNKDGLTWFINNCWQELKNEIPNLKLHIVGKWSKMSIDNLDLSTDIEFHGYVDDLDQLLHNGIFIVPIRIGSGMRMKIIDSIMYGLPIVTTTIGQEGFDFNFNTECLIGDSAEEFINQIIRIYKSPSLANTLIVNSRQKLKNHYDYNDLIEIRKESYNF